MHTFLNKAYELKIVSTYYCNLRNFILKHSFENNNAIFFVDDISSFQDIIYFNVVEYGMDKEGADFRACKNYGCLLYTSDAADD